MKRHTVQIVKIINLVCVVALAVWLSPHASTHQDQIQNNPAIGYRSAGGNDAVAHLRQRIIKGEVKLEFNSRNGYLESLLKELRIPVSSQGLVFSKTSFQLHRISPDNPRAIFFNDDVYVGWVRGGEMLEVAAVDPQLGGVFYMLDQTKPDKPQLTRNDECLQCHVSNATRNVPGFVVRSVYPDERGYPIAPLGSHITNHASPLSERWGGWYVTGTHGEARHAGNMLFSETSRPDVPDQLSGGNLTSLDKKFSPSGYPSAHSDIVALLVLEHQSQMHNLITRLNYETKLALHSQRVMNEALKQPNDEMSETTKRRIARAADDLVRHLLFVGEETWKSPISGTTSFAREFAAMGPRDKQGRSLRDLDLKQKLFRYPCSFLIHSEAFDSLPKPALDEVFRQLWAALTGQTRDKEFTSIPEADRTAVLDILRQTKPGLPEYFHRLTRQP